MKANKFYHLKEIIGNSKDFHRKQGGFCKKGIYFWGFSTNPNGGLPKKENEIVIYYIGKSQSNIAERIMQEITQLIFGGFGTIIDKNWLINHPFNARIYTKQETIGDTDVLYKSDGLHVLYDFLKTKNKSLIETLDWMKENFIFTWIDSSDNESINKIESEMHHIVRTNCFGIGRIKQLHKKRDVNNKLETPFFNSIDWSENELLKKWLIETNNHIL
jgi:hypothetical protein